MSRTIWVGAVAYDPKVVTIWEGMRRYFHEEARLPVEVVLFQSYEAQVERCWPRPAIPCRASTSPGTPTSPTCRPTSGAASGCRPIAMRDTDLGWTTKIVAVSGGPGRCACRSARSHLALGSRDSGHAAILPVHFLAQQGLVEGRDYRTLRFNSDVGKHGDTGTSEAEVVRAVLDGRADAGAIGSPFWQAVRSERLVPQGALSEIWTSPPYNHCMFTARPDLDRAPSGSSPRRCPGWATTIRATVPCSRPKGCAAGCRRTSMATVRCGRRLRSRGSSTAGRDIGRRLK